MKKARFLLSVLLIVAVLGLSLAFKASEYSLHFIYTGIKGSGVCTVKVTGAGICNGIPNVALSTSSLAAGCPDGFYCTISD